MRRSGIAIPLVVVMMLMLAVIGAGLIFLSRTTGRLSHWYHHGQMAFDLAQAGMREALLVLDDLQGAAAGGPAAGGLPPDAPAAVLDVIRGVSSQREIPLMEGRKDSATNVTVSLAKMIETLGRSEPTLRVRVEVLGDAPLVDTPQGGIVPLAKERKGQLKVTSSATISPDVTGAISVTRDVVAYREYRLVNILPPVFGKFPIFFEEAGPAADLNSIRVEFDQGTGDGRVAGRHPLVLANKASETGIAGNTLQNVDWASKFGLDFLDKQGWVFLGRGSGAAGWRLNLAFGYRGESENFHLPSSRRRQLFGATTGDDSAALAASESAFNAGLGCTIDLTSSREYGLLAFSHGFCSNYEDVGYLRREDVMEDGRRTNFDLGEPLGSSILRPMGTAEAMSPTIVLGDVNRAYIQQAAFYGNLTSDCYGLTGPFEIALHLWEDHVERGEGGQSQFIQEAFGGKERYEKYGSGIIEEPYYLSLLTILSATKPVGEVHSRGFVTPAPATGASPVYKSALIPDLAQIKPETAPAPALLDKLRAGRVKIGAHFDGDLNGALVGFQNLLSIYKNTRKMKGSQLVRRYLRGGDLRVPGVVMIEDSPWTAPAISSISRGGVLMASGDIAIAENIERGANLEPLTIVSLNGTIKIADGVQKIDAFLVADKTIDLPDSGDLTIRGGLAAGKLDPGWRGTSGRATVEFVPEFDPTAPGSVEKYLQAFPVDEVRLVVEEAP